MQDAKDLRRRLPVVFAIALLALPHNGNGQTPQPEQTKPTAQVIPSSRSESGARADSTEKADHAWNERWTAIATIVVAGATLCLFVGTAFLARYTLKLWKETQRLANEAKESATDTLNHLKETSALELRAYLVVAHADFKDEKAVVTVQNGGRTPAKKFSPHILCRVLDRGAPHEVPSGGDIPPELQSQGELGPVPVELSAHIPSHPYGMEAMMSSQVVRVMGGAAYNDVLGKPHRVQFCLSASMGHFAGRGGQFQTCTVPGHNFSD